MPLVPKMERKNIYLPLSFGIEKGIFYFFMAINAKKIATRFRKKLFSIAGKFPIRSEKDAEAHSDTLSRYSLVLSYPLAVPALSCLPYFLGCSALSVLPCSLALPYPWGCSRPFSLSCPFTVPYSFSFSAGRFLPQCKLRQERRGLSTSPPREDSGPHSGCCHLMQEHLPPVRHSPPGVFPEFPAGFTASSPVPITVLLITMV